jgi:tetratricopeptide (TPR) repeat protein
MKLGALVMVAVAAAGGVLGLGCSRNRQEAVLMANKGDQEVKLNIEGAINSYDQATRLDPTNHRILFKLAMAYRKKEDWDKVASTLARAASVAPKYANYWFERGYALEMQARKKIVTSYDEAREPFQKCVEADPNYAECYEELGNVFLQTDDEQKAIENYTKAIEHDPNNISYYNVLADLYIRLGYMNQAEQVLKEAKGFLKPTDKNQEKANFGVHMLLAQVYQDRGSQAEQVAELEAAKATATEGAEAIQILFALGSTYALLPQPKSAEAIQMLRGFNARACKGAKAQTYRTECETTQTLVAKLGGTLQ